MCLAEFCFNIKPCFFSISDLKSGKLSITAGFSTVKRENTTYVFQTLESLLTNCTYNSKIYDYNFIVLIAEIDQRVVQKIANDIFKKFEKFIVNGTLEIISPPM